MAKICRTKGEIFFTQSHPVFIFNLIRTFQAAARSRPRGRGRERECLVNRQNRICDHQTSLTLSLFSLFSPPLSIFCLYCVKKLCACIRSHSGVSGTRREGGGFDFWTFYSFFVLFMMKLMHACMHVCMYVCALTCVCMCK